MQSQATVDGWVITDTSHYQLTGGDAEQWDWIESTDRRWVGKIYTADVYPQWVDFFEVFNQSMRDAEGVGIDRPWTADDVASAAKLNIDSAYIEAVSDYNAEFGTHVLVDTRYLGINVQPNGYTPKPAFRSLFSQMAPVIGIGLAFFGVPVLLGEAILGAEIAAAYPLATQAVGNVAISTAMNGGDVGKSVTGALIGMAGSQVGDFAGSVSDSQAIGQVAAIVTKSALSGQPIGTVSAISAALNIGSEVIKMGDNYAYDDYAYTPDFLGDWGITVDPVTLTESLADNEQVITDSGYTIDTVLPDAAGNIYTADGSFIALDPVVYASSMYINENGAVMTPDNQELLSDAEVWAILDANPGNETQALSDAMRDKWLVDQGQVSDSAPATATRPKAIPPAAAQTKTPDFAGTLKETDALLRTSASLLTTIKALSQGRPVPYVSGTTPYTQAVGVPIKQANGNTITNNGNGTQTIRTPSGATSTVSSTYTGLATSQVGATVSGVSNQTLMIGAAAVAAFLLMGK